MCKDKKLPDLLRYDQCKAQQMHDEAILENT